MKRIISLITLIAILISVMTGCSSAVTTGTKDEQVQETTKAKLETTAGTTLATTEDVPEGPQVTAPGELPVTTEQVSLTIGLSQNIRVSDYKDNFQTKMVLDECGIDLEFELFPSDQPKQKFQLMVSSGQELPDVVWLAFTDSERFSYGRDGVFVPLNDYMDTLTFWYDQGDLDQADFDSIRVLGTSPDGNFYSFPAFTRGFGDIIMYMTNINRTWLEELDLEIPTTTDEFREVLIAFRDLDPNGNGKNDEIPFITGPVWSGNTWHEIINSFVYWCPYYPTSYFNVTDGELWAPFTTDEFRDALRYLNGLVEDGLMSELSFAISSEEVRATVDLPPDEIDTVGVIGGHYVVLWSGNNEHIYNYDSLPALKGPKGVNYMPTRTPNYHFSSFITKDNPYPEITFRMFDYWWEEKRSLLNRYGEPGVHWEYYLDDVEGFNERYPYLSAGCIALGIDQPKFARIADVQDPWTSSEPINSIWNITVCNGLPERLYSASAGREPVATYWSEAVENGWDTGSHTGYLNSMCYQSRVNREPDELVKKLVFTDSEEEKINEIRTTINGYIDEAIALFCTGAMDIEKDWDSYLQKLLDMGLETYQEVSQAAYDRMYK